MDAWLGRRMRAILEFRGPRARQPLCTYTVVDPHMRARATGYADLVS